MQVIDPTAADGMPEEKPELELEGKQVEDLRLDNPQVGQKFQLSAMATIKEVMTGKGENGMPTSELCFELDGIQLQGETPDPAAYMYSSMMK